MTRPRKPKSSDQSFALPKVGVIEITGTDGDGELLARPVSWRRDDEPPMIVMAPGDGARGRTPALGVGDRVLARLRRVSKLEYEASIIRRVSAAPSRVLGIYEVIDGKGRLLPTEKRARQDFSVGPGDAMAAVPGELVIAEVKPASRARLGLKSATVVERLGSMKEPRSISRIAIYGHGIPVEFSAAAVKEAERAGAAELGDRTDLRDLALVTIDPHDARDFDDAVSAARDDDPKNAGGWRVVVAIADVAHYVTEGSALDRDARERGNSIYFPDRVVPMLPEALSADLCSLRAGEDRPCMAVRMWFDGSGRRLRHEFLRGLMRSRASLNYAQVQRARDGQPDELTGPILDGVIEPLYGAYAALAAARDRRAPLALDLPERRITLDDDGRVEAVNLSPRFDSHRLIEEFMIQANICAAMTLGKRKAPCMYRVHESPAPEKLDALRDFLASLGFGLAKGQTLKPRDFNEILAKTAATPHARIVNEVILRSQSQAYYSPENRGHFGLALRQYGHFTSPIRRYSDLLVHRSLISALGFGDDGISAGEAARMVETGEHISQTERRAALAERESKDRFLAAFMADRIGAEFGGRISGVSRFGLFVTLDETGADGLVPMRSLRDDYYRHDEGNHALVGERSGLEYRLGASVRVRLAEAVPLTGGMRFELLSDPVKGNARRSGKRRARRGGSRRRR